MKLTEILSIVENKFAVPEGKDYHKIVPELEKNLGSSDTDIRENSLEILWAWVTKGVLTDKELIELGNRLVTNLHIGLGEVDTDSVFLRSFSTLILAGVIRTDSNYLEGKIENRKPFLTRDLLIDWLNRAIEFFIDEKDLRGYIQIKKWAHAIAHGSDLFKVFSNHPLLERDEHIKILETIAKKLGQPAEHVFSAYEEARICSVVATIQTRNLVSLEDYEQWLQQIIAPFADVAWYDDKPDPSTFNFRLNARVNVRLFLTRLYFMLLFDIQQISSTNKILYDTISQYSNSLLDLIIQALKKFSSYNIYAQE
ncbi:MAG TPA: DUF2785 domain-containing protein [Candidatus Bathyarchaeia archaeon]|nr:DUF2785 domain-containing protein [Candidatus Bathyarchaeia archaeon]